MPQTIEMSSIEEARAYVAANGPALVLSPEALDALRDAEAAGGGMTGVSDGAPYSAEGVDRSADQSTSDGTPVDFAYSEHLFGYSFDDLAETFLDAKDLWEAVTGDVLGPVLLVPSRELHRLLGDAPPDDA